MQRPLNIWKITDGKPGHESQIDGLIGAIRASCEVDESVIQVKKSPSVFSLFFSWLFRKRPSLFPQDSPDLIVGAGHRTHSTMLLAKSFCGGKTVVLMKPSLPLKRFDFIVVPCHDQVQPSANVIETQGALNSVPFVRGKDMQTGLMLVGGESKHYAWDNENILSQIKHIIEQDTNIRWTLTTSRRTPETFLQLLDGSAIEVVPFENTDSNWLLAHYRQSGRIWVTPDSVSMVYESLSSGAITNIFSIEPSTASSRVRAGLEKLIEDKTVCSFEDWKQESKFEQLPKEFSESDRVASIILDKIA